MTARFDGTSGQTYYAKPQPLSSTPSWASDVVAATENGTTGEFSFNNVATTAYWVFLQAGGSPASSDVKTHVVPVETPTATSISQYIAGDVSTLTGDWIDAVQVIQTGLATMQNVTDAKTEILSEFETINITSLAGSTEAVEKLRDSSLTIIQGEVQDESTTTSIKCTLSPSITTSKQIKPKIILFTSDTITEELRALPVRIYDVTIDGSDITITVNTLPETPVEGDTFIIA